MAQPINPTEELDLRLTPTGRVIKLNDEQWEAFMAAFDAPPRARPRLKRLLTEPGILD
jgi:uncharacterized protein (DUF1778 family)